MNLYETTIDGMPYSGYVRNIKLTENTFMKFHEGTTDSTYKDVSGRLTCFFSKEPETINWIRTTMSSESMLWDIGANIGQYGIYAASLHNCPTYLIEPEAQNFSTLCYNLKLNQLTHVLPFPLALSDQKGYNNIKLLSSPGCSNISIEKKYAQYQGIWTDTIDSMVDQGFKIPTHLKIDVDGVELKILKGASNTLQHVQSILVETEEGLISTVTDYLRAFGFNPPSLHKRAIPGIYNLIFNK